MIIHFHIHYFTSPGQVLVVCGNTPETGQGIVSAAPVMTYQGDGHWLLSLSHDESVQLDYRYYVCEGTQIIREEYGRPHRLTLLDTVEHCTVNDFWQAEPDSPILYASAFSDSLLSVTDSPVELPGKPGSLLFRVVAPLVRSHQYVALSGDINALGNWDPSRALPLLPGAFPEWQVSLEASTLPPSFHYKFLLINKDDGALAAWEWGEPRELVVGSYDPGRLHVEAGLSFRCQEAPWKGVGVAIPVFSLRSEGSWGCGDFGDLLQFIVWVADTGQQMVQLLPINDTTHSGSWTDSYPYNAISVHALHPLYLCPGLMPVLQDEALVTSFESKRVQLNRLPDMDYQAAWSLKRTYLVALFKQEGQECMKTEGYASFVAENRYWLVPYAAYCYLRDSLKTADFNQWGEYAVCSPSLIERLCEASQPWHDELVFHYVVQYWLHLQLKQVRDAAHARRVILKGDIPIGVNPEGVEAWSKPHLFNASVQVGAPPDEFSTTGQNWGFPSYDWEAMENDGYAWWKQRMEHMAHYFDAYRIDHILGFFRIWEIPAHSVRGLLGQFNPSMPYTVMELVENGIDFTEDMTMPVFTLETLSTLFGEHAGFVADTFSKKVRGGLFTLKAFCNTQQKIRTWLNEHPKHNHLQEGLFTLCEEVLFVKDQGMASFSKGWHPSSGDGTPLLMHPRIMGFQTDRFKLLTAEEQTYYRELHDEFFYRRQNNFWEQQARKKLKPLVEATRMLACGEDLGMIPSCVPHVMRDLQILSLEIQRMPKQQGQRFENLNAIPYLSVCSPSTHDLNPLRAWWLENKETTTQYYQQVLWKPGVTPAECTPEIARDILLQHLESPAMWVVVPWQDWLAIDAILRRQHPEEERINEPSNSRHYWRYRMHLTLEELIASPYLTKTIRSLIKQTGRL